MKGDNCTTAAQEMPKYKCHKEVWALKIQSIKSVPNGIEVTPFDEGYAPIFLDCHFVDQHKPQVGGYYVLYKGGYDSYSPADAFEEGYTRI